MEERQAIWRVQAKGVMGTVYTYNYPCEGMTALQAVSQAYGDHGRRYGQGEVDEYLGAQSTVESVYV